MQNYRYSWNCRHWQEFVLFGGAEIIAWNSINLFPDKTRKDLALPPRGREQLDASIVLFADMETTGPLGCVPHLHFIQAISLLQGVDQERLGNGNAQLVCGRASGLR